MRILTRNTRMHSCSPSSVTLVGQEKLPSPYHTSHHHLQKCYFENDLRGTEKNMLIFRRLLKYKLVTTTTSSNHVFLPKSFLSSTKDLKEIKQASGGITKLPLASQVLYAAPVISRKSYSGTDCCCYLQEKSQSSSSRLITIKMITNVLKCPNPLLKSHFAAAKAIFAFLL